MLILVIKTGNNCSNDMLVTFICLMHMSHLCGVLPSFSPLSPLPLQLYDPGHTIITYLSKANNYLGLLL